MAKNKNSVKEETRSKEVGAAGEDATKQILFASIKKKYGNVLVPLSDETTGIATISTGSLSLDLALGRGGMAFGRIYEVYGPNSGGKSTLAAHVIIQAQRRGLRCAYLDAEQAADPKLFEKYGIIAKDLDLIRVYGGEPNLDILEQLVRLGTYSVIVVDSISALIPLAEAEAEMDKDSMALLARLMSKALRKVAPQAAAFGTLVIFINQLRMKVGTYGNPETTTGGEALGFWATGRISVRGPESKERRLVNVAGETYGHKAIHEVVKNKLGEPFKKASLNLLYGKGYDFHHEILEMAAGLDVIEKAGSWYKYNGENIGQGADNSTAALKENEQLFNEIRGKVIELVGLKEQYELHSNPGPIYSGKTVPTESN